MEVGSSFVTLVLFMVIKARFFFFFLALKQNADKSCLRYLFCSLSEFIILEVTNGSLISKVLPRRFALLPYSSEF